MKKNVLIAGGVVALVLIGLAFFGGIMYGKSQNAGPRFGAPNGNVSIRGNRQGGGGFNAGEIIAKDDKSITIKLPAGGSKIILFSDKTEIGKFTTGTTNDLEVGKTVMVQGQPSPDGSVVAQSIQLRPAPVQK